MTEQFDTLPENVYEIKLTRGEQFTVEGPYLSPEETARLNPPKPEGEEWQSDWWRVREHPEAWRHGWRRWKGATQG